MAEPYRGKPRASRVCPYQPTPHSVIGALAAARPQFSIRGGWVYAIGSGSLDRRDSSLHRRDRLAVNRRGSYLSIDTGKYSIAPWLARRITDELLGR